MHRHPAHWRTLKGLPMSDQSDSLRTSLGEWVGKTARSLQHAIRFNLDLTARDLERLLSSTTPWISRWRGVSVSFDRPRIAIEKGNDEVCLRMLLTVQLPMSRPIRGTVEVRGRLRYDPDQGRLHLDALECTDLALAGFRRPLLPLRLGLPPLLRPWLAKRPVFEWRADSRTHALARGTLMALEVRNGCVRLHFRAGREPVRA